MCIFCARIFSLDYVNIRPKVPEKVGHMCWIMVSCPYLGKKGKKYPKIECAQKSKQSIPIDRKFDADHLSYINHTLETNTSEDIAHGSFYILALPIESIVNPF